MQFRVSCFLVCYKLFVRNWIAGQSEHTAYFRVMSFVKINVFQKCGAERRNSNVRRVFFEL